MKYAIQIHTGPSRSQAACNAYQFIRAALVAGHEIPRVFFYHDGVYHGIAAAGQGQGPDWPGLAREHGIDLVLCIAAAERRGLCDDAGRTATALLPGFRLGGLGQWVEACLGADRLLVFGE